MDITTAIRQVGSVTIVDITGNLVFGDTTSIRSVTSDLLSRDLKKILFNLSGVHHIDSSGVSCLVRVFTGVRKQGGELKLLSPTKNVRDLLRFTNLDAVFDILDDEASAIGSFGASAAASS